MNSALLFKVHVFNVDSSNGDGRPVLQHMKEQAVLTDCNYSCKHMNKALRNNKSTASIMSRRLGVINGVQRAHMKMTGCCHSG